MRRGLIILGWLVAIFVAAPLAVVVPISFSDAVSLEFPPPGWSLRWYYHYFSDPRWIDPTINSLVIACGVTVVTMALVTPAAFALVRYRFGGKGAVNLLLMLPLVVPHIVIANGYYAFLAEIGLLHSFAGVILAHTALSVPVAFLVLTASLKGFDRTLERAAMSLGAPPWQVFRHVTVPVLWPGFAAAALFAFVQSFDETVVAIFVSGADSQTLPRKMFDAIRMQADPVIAVVSTLLFGVVALLALAAMLRRRAGG